jgi:hypothetical protein
MAERLGRMIVDRCGWTDVTVQWVTHQQARLVPHSRNWWSTGPSTTTSTPTTDTSPRLLPAE